MMSRIQSMRWRRNASGAPRKDASSGPGQALTSCSSAGSGVSGLVRAAGLGSGLTGIAFVLPCRTPHKDAGFT